MIRQRNSNDAKAQCVHHQMRDSTFCFTTTRKMYTVILGLKIIENFKSKRK